MPSSRMVGGMFGLEVGQDLMAPGIPGMPGFLDGRHLAEGLREMAIFPDLPEGVVPLGFPVRMAERDAARQRLFAEDIYPPVHWPIEDVVPPEFQSSHRLARWIMTLPCDQRCSPDDLDRALAILQRMGARPANVAI